MAGNYLSDIFHDAFGTFKACKMATIIPLAIEYQVASPLYSSLRAGLSIPVEACVAKRCLDPVYRLHGKSGKIFMPDVLVVGQARSHDTVAEVVDRGSGQDVLSPLLRFLLLWIGSLVVFLTKPDHYANRIVLQHPADSMRSRPHHDGVSHVVLEPIVNSTLHLLLPSGQIDILREWCGGEVEVHDFAGVGVVCSKLSSNPVTPIARLNTVILVAESLHQRMEEASGML